MNERVALVNLGYIAIRTSDGLTYNKAYQSAGLCFDIELDPTPINTGHLPIAKLVRYPEVLRDQAIPHVSGKRFCYVDEETISWDPLDIEDTFALVDKLIQRTVNVIASGRWEGEYDGEFINYWCGHIPLFLLTKAVENHHSLICRELVVIDSLGEPKREIVVSSDQGLFEQWGNARNGRYEDTNYPAVAIRVSPSMPLGSKWPPDNFKELMDWLKKCDHNAHNVLTDRLANKLRGTNKSKILCLVSTGNGGDFGWTLQYDHNVAKFFSTMRKGISTKIASQRLTSKSWLKEMQRVSVQLADPEFITTRNLAQGNISFAGCRIALIGAGTIGGFLAKMLVDAGAGTWQGSLTIFDADVLSTDNLGRHVLPVQFVGWLKSSALVHYLRAIIPYPVDLKAQSNWCVSNNRLSGFDLVIDATGREPFSLLLANTFHSFKRQTPSNNTTLVHVWIDGAGHVVRGLLDTAKPGQACYGCINEESHPVFSSMDRNVHQIYSQRCGSTYTPYPSGTSQTAAALAQNLALESLRERPRITFQQIALTDKAANRRPMKLKKARICRVTSHV
ncbi:hypothetical protein FG475_15260 [Vibrio navarrensis]|uniref:ThiF family adenylyltransferase n=1 Tax=Vibrio navarrensis TaxID=29495 RepID=UPI0018DD69E2|nr:ThiF family adenylyltransferase [Vibrio navarrensis]EHA1126478.1 hypothetical protein [Vibrio navarrensis]MBH9740044.1 hypothetical protein [Vibrio navarrensis]HDY8121387.1 ThiF family adenylyltransferase [Vibrio vulnificus]